MANPGYGKRVIPDQPFRHRNDFAHLPEREAYIAAYVDRLPDGAAMDVKTLAKCLPHYGQQAVRSALARLSVAGHLRRVREMVGGDQTRWVYRTYFSRMAHEDGWWEHFLADEAPRAPISPAPDEPVTATEPSSPPEHRAVRAAGVTVPPSTAGAVPSARPGGPAVRAARPRVFRPAPDTAPPTAPERATVQATEPPAPPTPATTAAAPGPSTRQPAPPPADPPATSDADEMPTAIRSAAYETLAELGRMDARLTLSVADCAALEPLAAAWLVRGISPSQLVVVLAAGLPEQVHSPAAFTRRRLVEKLPAGPPPVAACVVASDPPPLRRMMECTLCGLPGPRAALTGGLCLKCRGESAPPPAGGLPIEEVKRYVQELRRAIRTHTSAPAAAPT